MEVLQDDTGERESVTTPVPTPDTAADSAMATGTDDEPEMTIADKHAGDSVPDPDGDGTLSREEAATLLGDTEQAIEKEQQ